MNNNSELVKLKKIMKKMKLPITSTSPHRPPSPSSPLISRMPRKFVRHRSVITVLVFFGLVNLMWYLSIKSNRGVPKESLVVLNYITNISFHDRVLAVDEQLHQLATHYVPHPFVHPKASSQDTTVAPTGPQMSTAPELAQITKLLIDVVKPCGGNLGRNQTLVTMVYNRVGDIERRMVIRETFGGGMKRHPKTSIYFIVGKESNAAMQEKLQREATAHNDIIQVDYLESYYNLTLKGLAMTRWMALNCPYAKYMLKLDDDCYVRINPLLKDLESRTGNAVLGLKRDREPVLRQQGVKWYISPTYYPYEHYPPYIGGVYMIPGLITTKLYEMVVSSPLTDTIPALPFDDCYVTGILPQKANVPVEFFNGIYQLWNEEDKNNTAVLQSHSIYYEKMEAPELRRFWKEFGDN